MKNRALSAGDLRQRPNINRKPTEAKSYTKGLVWIEGKLQVVLFTPRDLQRPIARGIKQPEDAPSRSLIKELRDILR